MAAQGSIPPRLLPVLYFGAAHLFLATALATAALAPGEVAGFLYHPRLIAVVHLVTLGWVSLSILGALYVVGPMALRLTMPARRIDYAAFAGAAIGIAGMAAHFWMEDYKGMTWAAIPAALGIVFVAGRTLVAIRRAPLELPVKTHVALACLNVFGAAALGVTLGVNKQTPFLPGSAMSAAFGHAHLAALGWAVMMIVGVGYRLFPMLLPASRPRGGSVLVSAVLLEIGAVGLCAGLLAGGRWLPPFAAAAALGILAFALHVAWMRRHRRRAPLGLRRPDFGVGHALQALVYAALSAALGLWLTLRPPADLTYRAAAVYGVFGLLGFLAQMVVGVESRVLPWFAVYHANRAMAACGPAPDPHAMPNRRLQAAAFAAWTAGVPLAAAGAAAADAAWVRAGALVLFTGVSCGSINTALVLRHAFRRPGDEVRTRR